MVHIVAGCDVSTATGNIFSLKDSQIVPYRVTPTTTKPETIARLALAEAIKKSGLACRDASDYVIRSAIARGDCLPKVSIFGHSPIREEPGCWSYPSGYWRYSNY